MLTVPVSLTTSLRGKLTGGQDEKNMLSGPSSHIRKAAETKTSKKLNWPASLNAYGEPILH